MRWACLDTESYRLKKGRGYRIFIGVLFSDPSSKYRDDRTTFHTIIDLTRVSVSWMFWSCSMYATSICDIEISTLDSCSFHESSCKMIEYIIWPTAESITPLTHSFSRRRHRKVDEKVETKRILLDEKVFLILATIPKNPKRKSASNKRQIFFLEKFAIEV